MSHAQMAVALATDLPALFGLTPDNPTAKVGLTAVNGVATSAMRSDAAPPLDQTIAPTMTGLWTFNGKVVVAAPASGVALSVTNVGSNASNPPALFTCTTAAGFCTLHSNGTNTSSGTGFNSGNEFQVGTFGGFKLQLVVNNVVAADFTVAASPACTFKGPIGVNNVTPPAQVTGFGTPTGAAVVANYPGATATLVQTSNTVAEILTILKAAGFIAT